MFRATAIERIDQNFYLPPDLFYLAVHAPRFGGFALVLGGSRQIELARLRVRARMPNANFVIALFTGIVTVTTVPLRASATEPPAIVLFTLSFPPDPTCTVHVGLRVPPTKITIPPALLTPLTRTLHSSERVTLWVGGQLARRSIYFDHDMPLTAAEVNESDTNHGWHPGPTHTIFGCLDRLPEPGAPILFGAPVPVPLGPAYDPSRLFIDATIPHRVVVPRIVH